MTVIELTTVIVAPVRICFELALSIDLVLEMGRSHRMRAVSAGDVGQDWSWRAGRVENQAVWDYSLACE